jgi:tetratricopeptide (TPR) repeat protein
MKLIQAVALALTLLPAIVVEGQSVRSPAETQVAQTISADLLRQPLSRKAKEILQKAQRAADAGDRARAIALLETASAKYPESNAWTQSMLGVEYLKTRQFDAAVTSLEQAIVLLPRDSADHSNLGFALASIGQYDRAEQQLRRALALDNSNVTTRHLLDAVLAGSVPGDKLASKSSRP